MRPLFSIHFLAFLLLLISIPCRAEESEKWEAGARTGFTFSTRYKNLEHYEVFLRRDLPWSYKISDSLDLGSRLEASAGSLTDWNRTGFVGSVGPDIKLDIHKIIVLHGGVRFTMISENIFGPVDLGGPVQFTSHAGINFLLGRHITLGYRFQHMSNANIYKVNLGLNMNMFELGLRF